MKVAGIRQLPLSRITCLPQVREQFDEDELAGLAQSVREVGLQQPILVRPNGDDWVVIDGERRLRAARTLGWETIPACVEESELSDADLVHRQLIANVQRSDLRPVEKARAIERLMRDTRWSAARVAEKLGVSSATVSKLLALLALPIDAQKRVDAGELPASTAYEAGRVRDVGERAQLLKEAGRGKLSRECVSARKRARTLPAPRIRRRAGRVVIPLGDKGSLSVIRPDVTLGCVVTLMEQLLARLRALGTDMSLRDAAEAIAGTSSAAGAAQ